MERHELLRGRRVLHHRRVPTTGCTGTLSDSYTYTCTDGLGDSNRDAIAQPVTEPVTVRQRDLPGPGTLLTAVPRDGRPSADHTPGVSLVIAQ
jgi:hypothetical protein